MKSITPQILFSDFEDTDMTAFYGIKLYTENRLKSSQIYDIN